jgi:hypothetical protein
MQSNVPSVVCFRTLTSRVVFGASIADLWTAPAWMAWYLWVNYVMKVCAPPQLADGAVMLTENT